MVNVDGLPPLHWLNGDVGAASADGNRLEMVAPPTSDWFNDPMGASRTASAPALVFEPSGDFQLTARVTVDFTSKFDAGVLFVHESSDDYAKFCFEYSPDPSPMVVSVVTRDVSDDCNGPAVEGSTVWMRVSRMGTTYAFHHSLDGQHWSMTRLFALRGRRTDAAVGFLAQAPTGDSCRAVFESVTFSETTLTDARDGT